MRQCMNVYEAKSVYQFELFGGPSDLPLLVKRRDDYLEMDNIYQFLWLATPGLEFTVL